jgi:3-oxoacyl-[acyl-carrier protein] reductase
MNVFITGGSRGIGRALVLKFVQEGWGCAFSYSRNESAARETLDLARETAPESLVKSYRFDVRDSAEVERNVEQAVSDFDSIHAVINNAAIVRNHAAVLMSDEDWEAVIAVNLSGPFYIIRSFLMHFMSLGGGRIVNISSLAQEGSSGQVNYAASKAGLIGLTRTVAKEYGPKGITANVVTVGYVQTDMTDEHLIPELHDYWMKHCPLRRVSTAQDIAGVVFFLCSPAGAFINGEVIRISGGLTYVP